MLKLSSLFFGIFYTLFGILSFIPVLTPENLLFNALKVNAASNVIHLVTGLVALSVVFIRPYFERIYFQIIGFIYAIMAIFGFIYGSSPMLGFVANSPALTWLHVITAVVALILGFGTPNTLEKRNS